MLVRLYRAYIVWTKDDGTVKSQTRTGRSSTDLFPNTEHNTIYLQNQPGLRRGTYPACDSPVRLFSLRYRFRRRTREANSRGISPEQGRRSCRGQKTTRTHTVTDEHCHGRFSTNVKQTTCPLSAEHAIHKSGRSGSRYIHTYERHVWPSIVDTKALVLTRLSHGRLCHAIDTDPPFRRVRTSPNPSPLSHGRNIRRVIWVSTPTPRHVLSAISATHKRTFPTIGIIYSTESNGT